MLSQKDLGGCLRSTKPSTMEQAVNLQVTSEIHPSAIYIPASLHIMLSKISLAWSSSALIPLKLSVGTGIAGARSISGSAWCRFVPKPGGYAPGQGRPTSAWAGGGQCPQLQVFMGLRSAAQP